MGGARVIERALLVWQALPLAVVVVVVVGFFLLVSSQQRDNPELALHGTERHCVALLLRRTGSGRHEASSL